MECYEKVYGWKESRKVVVLAGVRGRWKGGIEVGRKGGRGSIGEGGGGCFMPKTDEKSIQLAVNSVLFKKQTRRTIGCLYSMIFLFIV